MLSITVWLNVVDYDLIVCFMYLRAERNIALAFLSGVHPDKTISSYTAGTWNPHQNSNLYLCVFVVEAHIYLIKRLSNNYICWSSNIVLNCLIKKFSTQQLRWACMNLVTVEGIRDMQFVPRLFNVKSKNLKFQSNRISYRHKLKC